MAKVNVGELYGCGKTKENEPKEALDHDMEPDLKMVSFGVFESSNITYRSYSETQISNFKYYIVVIHVL